MGLQHQRRLTAYDGGLAVASLVEDGTSGVDSAGYVVRDILIAQWTLAGSAAADQRDSFAQP
ncbi:hypothetical protein DI272_09880 [Streptomyces sp. Act143]|uniref:hypothetical protein n=1 Tax=Streptomyces sp. Act143 TaxID=2200760 RepID=UPI000D67E501|nr:hypothetical protein [Streptomyces sp. Act143]PWI14427.1 hypothetical protein DI272_09880 [Streptomyces sp. Act143]